MGAGDSCRHALGKSLELHLSQFVKRKRLVTYHTNGVDVAVVRSADPGFERDAGSPLNAAVAAS